MFKLLIGAAIGFAAAWFMDSKEGEQRRALVKDKATTVAGKGKEQAAGVAGQVKDKVSSDGRRADCRGRLFRRARPAGLQAVLTAASGRCASSLSAASRRASRSAR